MKDIFLIVEYCLKHSFRNCKIGKPLKICTKLGTDVSDRKGKTFSLLKSAKNMTPPFLTKNSQIHTLPEFSNSQLNKVSWIVNKCYMKISASRIHVTERFYVFQLFSGSNYGAKKSKKPKMSFFDTFMTLL